MAQCVDARKEGIGRSDRFLLDTNVALDLASTIGGDEQAMRRRSYAAFANRARSAGADVFISVLSFFEIANVLEREQFRLRNGAKPLDTREIKAFRKDVAARAAVVTEIETVWNDLRSSFQILDSVIAAHAAKVSIFKSLKNSVLDAFDAVIIEEARRAGISTIVTHDADFASAAGIIVFTVNERMLRG